MSYCLQAPRELFDKAQAAGIDIEKEIMRWHVEGEQLPEVHKRAYGNVYVVSSYHRHSKSLPTPVSYHVFVIVGDKLVWDCNSASKGIGMGCDHAAVHRFAKNVQQNGVRSQLGMQVMSAVYYGWHTDIDYGKL